MKKTVLTITAALLVTAAACAAAPELRNMMPNSWEKLARLTAEEEKGFLSQQQVKSDIEGIKSRSWGAPKYTIKEKRVYKEKANNVEFYRVLACNQNMADFLNAEYRDGAAAKAEYDSFIKCSMQQTVYAKQEEREIYKICSLEYRVYGISEGNMETKGCEYFVFHDFLIKELNKNEIGFFMTETSIGYQAELKNNNVGIDYCKEKGQMCGANSSEFLRVKNEEDFVKALRDNDRRVRIQASDYLFDSRCPLKYSIQNAFDGNPATSYVENTEDDLMKIEFSGFKSMFNRKVNLAIINGYSSNKELYIANNRILNLNANSYKVSDDKTELILREPISLELQDMNLKYQIVSFDYNNRIGSFSFNVTKIVKGKFYNDTCLAELNLSESTDYIFGDIYE